MADWMVGDVAAWPSTIDEFVVYARDKLAGA